MGLVRSIAVVLVAAGILAGSAQSDRVYEQGRQAERMGRSVQAYLLYLQASQLDPKNQLYALKAIALKPMALKSVHMDVSSKSADPLNKMTDSLTDEDTAAMERMSEPVRL